MSSKLKNMYESDITKFIRDLLEKRPEIKEDQKKARAMWWDKTLDRNEIKRQESVLVPRSSYEYYDTPVAPDKSDSSKD